MEFLREQLYVKAVVWHTVALSVCMYGRNQGIACSILCFILVLYLCVTGTNLQALMEQAKKASSAAEIVVVISNRPGVLGLKRASMAGIQTRVSWDQCPY